MSGEFSLKKVPKEQRDEIIALLQSLAGRLDDSATQIQSELEAAAQLFEKNPGAVEMEALKKVPEMVAFLEEDAFGLADLVSAPLDESSAAHTICQQIDVYARALRLISVANSMPGNCFSTANLADEALRLQELLREGLWQTLLAGELFHDS